MNKYTLLFNNPIQEKQYRQYITSERGKPLRIIITLQSFNEFIMLSSIVYYYLKGLNNFGNAFDFIIYQIIVFLANAILALQMYFKLINFGKTTLIFILIHILRVILNLYMPGFFGHQLQFFSQFQYGYSCFLIIIIVTFSYHFIFKATSILLLNAAVFFLYEYEYNNFYTMSFISAVLCYKVFTDEKTFRQDFLIKQKMEKWMLIVDRVIPSSVFITKFNPREEIIELSQSNQKAKNQFDVKNSEQFQTFIARTFLDKNSENTTANNPLPPNNLKVRIRKLIDNERQNFQKKLYQRKMSEGVQKYKTIEESSSKMIAINYSNSNMYAAQQNNGRVHAESRYSQRSNSIHTPQIPSKIVQNLGSQGNMNNIPLPFRNQVRRNKKINDPSSPNARKFSKNFENSLINNQNNDNFHSLSYEQVQNQVENDPLNLSSPTQPVYRKGRKAKTIKNRQQIFKNNSVSNELSHLTTEKETNNFILGYYRKDEISEQQTFSIKLYSYYLEEIYVIVVIDEESYEDRLIREKNKFRDFQINSNRFVNELSSQSRNMFAELRSQQIQYLNEQQLFLNHDIMKEQNMRAINHCFGIINNIDNFIIGHNTITTTILENEIKDVDLNQLFDNLLKVLQLLKEERNIKCVVYNTYKKQLLSSSKYLTQLIFNILNLSMQVCAENGLIQIEVKEINKTYYTSYIEICIKHTLKEDSFSIFNFCEQQRMMFETSKKLLELISPYSKFFIKQRKHFYAQIKFYIYKDLNEINHLNRSRQTMYHNIHQTVIGEGNHLIEQEECQSDDLSLELSDPRINPIDSIKETHKNTRNQSKIVITTVQENTENPFKLSLECHDEDQHKCDTQYLQIQGQTHQMTQSTYVEGISGYKIPFGKLFVEDQKQFKNQDQDHQEQENDEYEDDYDEEEENQKSDQDSSLQNYENKRERQQKQKLRSGQKNAQKKSKLEQSFKSDEKKTQSNTDSPLHSKKRFSSRLDTVNTTQKSQHNIRSKKNSCFNENNNETHQLYYQDPQKTPKTIKEADEEMTKSMSSNQISYPNNVQDIGRNNYIVDEVQKSLECSFSSYNQSQSPFPCEEIITNKGMDEIKESEADLILNKQSNNQNKSIFTIENNSSQLYKSIQNQPE